MQLQLIIHFQNILKYYYILNKFDSNIKIYMINIEYK